MKPIPIRHFADSIAWWIWQYFSALVILSILSRCPTPLAESQSQIKTELRGVLQMAVDAQCLS